MGKNRGKVKEIRQEKADEDPPPWLRPGWGPAFPKHLIGCDACPIRVHPNDGKGMENHRQKCGNQMRSDAGKADYMICIGCGKQWPRKNKLHIIKHEGVCDKFKALGVVEKAPLGTGVQLAAIDKRSVASTSESPTTSSSSRSTTRPKTPRGPRRVIRARARTLGVELARPLNFDFLNKRRGEKVENTQIPPKFIKAFKRAGREMLRKYSKAKTEAKAAGRKPPPPEIRPGWKRENGWSRVACLKCGRSYGCFEFYPQLLHEQTCGVPNNRASGSRVACDVPSVEKSANAITMPVYPPRPTETYTQYYVY